jgi:hypothetical protein
MLLIIMVYGWLEPKSLPLNIYTFSEHLLSKKCYSINTMNNNQKQQRLLNLLAEKEMKLMNLY